MVASRCLGSLAVLAVSAEGARISRKHSVSRAPNTKLIAGVPILNYDTAYDGEGAFVEGQSEGEWVLVARAGVTEAQLEQMCQASPHGCRLRGHPIKGGVPFLEMRGTEQDLEAMINSVGADVVKFVEPDQRVEMIPELEASPEASTWGLGRIGADQRGRSGSSTTIFVLDTGVRVSHNDFGGRASPALDMTEGEPKECAGDLTCAADRQGHGTHCAGTAGGSQFGVAPAASVQGVKVLGDTGSGQFSWSYYALDWLAKSTTRPVVASMSLGGRCAYGNCDSQQAMKEAVNAAVNSGVVVVVAGGNSRGDACGFSPAFIPSAITVGSTTSLDARSSFSNYGSCTNIWAPGSDVVSAGHRSDDETVKMSGTSMACPHVSGAAALVLEADPTMKPSAVLTELISKASFNRIRGLWAEDTNALVYVGADGPPPSAAPIPADPIPTPAPTPVPTPATPPPGTDPRCASKNGVGPDRNGDCQCLSGMYCYEDGQARCTWSGTQQFGGKAWRYFLATCDGCTCRAD